MSLAGGFVQTPDGRVFVHRSGSPAGGAPPLVVVHGLMLSHYYFAPIMEALRDGREVIAVDLLGFGESDRPPVSRFDYRPSLHTETLVQVLDHLRIGAFDLLGHSMGGAIALEAAARLPDRVRRVVAMAPALFPLPLDARQRLLLTPAVGDLLWNTLLTRRELGRVFRQEQVVRPADISDAFLDFFWARFNRPGGRAAALATARAIAFRADPTPILSKVQAPVLILQGESDRLVPLANARRLQATLSSAALTILPAAGHHPVVERPRLVLRHLTSHLRA